MKQFFEKNKRGLLAMAGVAAILAVFSVVAFHNLGKFETSDEDLWKEDRIERYWFGMRNGLKNGDFRETYVNDKPGVTVSILSGPMLFFVPDPRLQGSIETRGGAYALQTYHSENAEMINRTLRIPIALFSVFCIALSAFLIYEWTRSGWTTVLFTAFVGLSPVLVGISQILNPDAILWGSVSVSLLAFLVMLRTGLWRYAVLSGLFFGIAIASKYTGNLLTVFFLLLLLGQWFFSGEKMLSLGEKQKVLWQTWCIHALGYGIFAFLVPYVLFRPELFVAGTFLARGIGAVIIPVVCVYGLFAFDALVFRGRFSERVAIFLSSVRPWILRGAAGVMLVVFLAHLANAWTGAQFVPLSDMRETVEYETGKKGNASVSLMFPFIDEENSILVALAKKILVQSSYIFFTLPTVTVVVLLAGMVYMVVFGRVRHYNFALFALTVPWIFIGGGLMADVLVNVRYGIVLQVFFGMLATLILVEGVRMVAKRYRSGVFILVFVGVFVGQLMALRSIAPHFLNYQNVFLPQWMSFADSWSYGMYEAAQWLNDRPNAHELEVWTDRKALCRFFVGKCIRDPQIDLSLVSPDYFVVTRRNVAKGNWFDWKKPELAKYPASYYYTEEVLSDPVWELHIGSRPLNYVKIIASKEREDADNENASVGSVRDADSGFADDAFRRED